MNKRLLSLAMVPALLLAGVAAAQYPVMDMVADNLVQRYQQSSCEQLWQERARKTLKQDPQMRAAFIARVAAPIANKMFECGMIP
jgi:hypothetical protein